MENLPAPVEALPTLTDERSAPVASPRDKWIVLYVWAMAPAANAAISGGFGKWAIGKRRVTLAVARPGLDVSRQRGVGGVVGWQPPRGQRPAGGAQTLSPPFAAQSELG